MDRVKSILGRRSSGNTASHFDWTYFRRMAVAVPLLLCAGWSAFGQSLQPGHLPSKKQVAPHDSRRREEPRLRSRLVERSRRSSPHRACSQLRGRGFHPAQSEYSYWSSCSCDVLQEPRACDRPDSRSTSNPPVVEGAKGNFVWLVFEHKFKDPKDPSQSVYDYSFDLFRIQNGKIQEHWDAARKNTPVPLRSFRPQLRRPQLGTQRNLQRQNNRTWRSQRASKRMSSNMDTSRTSKSFFRHPSSSTILSCPLTVKA